MRSQVVQAVSLLERRDRIIAHIEHAAIEVGRELLAAKRDHPGSFQKWLLAEVPISPDKARALMAIARTFDEAPPEVVAQLPKGWTVLLEISKLSGDTFAEAVAHGQITPRTTAPEVRAIRDEATRRSLGMKLAAPPKATGEKRPGVGGAPPSASRLSADMVARELIRRPRADLTRPVEDMLRAWLGEGDRDGLDEGELSGP